MADSRSLSFGVQFGTDTAPLDELNEKQRKAQEEAERTADKLEQIGTSLTDVGTRATAAFNNVSGAGTKMGTSVRSAMLAGTYTRLRPPETRLDTVWRLGDETRCSFNRSTSPTD